jgi:hypothetical protein
MEHNNPFRILWPLCSLLLCLFPAVDTAADNRKAIVLTMPAEAVLAALQQAVPLTFSTRNRQVQGDITIESVDQLVIHNSIISMHGMLVGRNLTVTTNLAGQDIQIRIGEVRLPVACDLQTRFDPARRKLLVTPQCKETALDPGNSINTQPSLLSAFDGREYPVDLDALKTINLKVGSGSMSITMEPVSVTGSDNALIMHMVPQVGVNGDGSAHLTKGDPHHAGQLPVLQDHPGRNPGR